MYLKMSSAEVVCCKQLPYITDELSIEANSVDPEQTAHSSLIWVQTVCHRGLFKYLSRREKQTTFVVIGALRVIFSDYQENNHKHAVCCIFHWLFKG